MYRFQKTEHGTIFDTKTGLEWITGPDVSTTWDEAMTWTKSLDLDGGGWRLPTRQELAGLYREGKSDRNMDPLFETTGWYIWALKPTHPNSPWEFNFFDGGTAEDKRHNPREFRAFAVRKPYSEDKRKHKRFEAKLPAYIEYPLRNHVKEVDNISAEGFFIQLQRPIHADSNITIRLVLQDSNGSEVIMVNGQVKFSLDEKEAREVGTQPGIGVKLIGFPTKEEESRFNQFVAMVSNTGTAFAMLEHQPGMK